MWNAHKIRKQPNQNVPHGRPQILYSSPHIVGAENCMCPADNDDIRICQEECVDMAMEQCDDTVTELCQLLIEEGVIVGVDMSNTITVQEKVDLYKKLRSEIRSLLGIDL